MGFPTQRTKLVDCHRSGSDADGAGQPTELLIVEGDSASRSVLQVRDQSFQAVLPMQGKPLNAARASVASVKRNPWYSALVDALGTGWKPDSENEMRYDRVLLLFDPDADGIHCGALVLMFFDRYLRQLLESRRVSLIKPPMFEIVVTDPRGKMKPEQLQAYDEVHLRRVESILDAKGYHCAHHRYRGLASLSSETLRELCVDPESRTAYLLRHEDAEAAANVFGWVGR